MNKTHLSYILTLLTVTFLLSCNSADDNDVTITIPTVDDECCNAEETFLAYTFLHNGYVKEIVSLRDTLQGKYAVGVYSASGKLHTGYNDLFFAVTKISTDGYVRDFSITDISPLMTMTGMGMQHATPASAEGQVYDASFPAVQRAWVSFIMSSEGDDFWTLSYKVSISSQSAVHAPTGISVNALPEGQEWVKSFKVNNDTYYLSLVNPTDLQTGSNVIRAYVSKKSTPATTPYGLAQEQFSIEIDPRMPDMDNHSSPNNKALTLQEDGSYLGTLNLTMTGLWRIHLTVKDAQGNTVAGGDDLKDGLSSLFWDVTI